jgi:tRNA pseudouridine55 synthase
LPESQYTLEKLHEGIILPFDKPLNWTSFDLVNKIRKYLCKVNGVKKLKVGHAGTLDPLATGLLILCTGKSTKKIIEIQSLPKEYIAEINLGATTPSFDMETLIDKRYNTNHLNTDFIIEQLKKFVGEILQVPPLYSAKNINGKRAYELARLGIKKELKPSVVEIYNLELLDFLNPVLRLKIICSKGTYVRSLARDIGFELGSGGYLSSLRRTAIGHYSIDSALITENFIRELYSV